MLEKVRLDLWYKNWDDPRSCQKGENEEAWCPCTRVVAYVFQNNSCTVCVVAQRNTALS